MKDMENLTFNTYADLARCVKKTNDRIQETSDGNKYDLCEISVVGFFDDAREIIGELVKLGFKIECVEITNVELDGYEDEFIVTVMDNEIWCEKMKREGGYLNDESSVTYVIDDCNSRVIEHLFSDKLCEVSIKEKNDKENCEHKETDVVKGTDLKVETEVTKSRDNDGKIHGFSLTKSNKHGSASYSFYTNDTLKEDRVDELINNFANLPF